ncbi:hypothetical protein PCANC_19876 [Puccinia coronata f. sp. avenae]|uniref:Uncharacterized protein n=1 Tax=Puccinia coronata f. sp. avenae TaxID=200324 RepID=A0A2N5UEV4_9BASI|nr:hypothetical protein PCANC_19876 [Puccinia coronata f. sp. avenae]
MAKEMAAILRKKASLQALKLSGKIQTPSALNKPSFFPTLSTINEDDKEVTVVSNDEIQEIFEDTNDEDIDPDDASEAALSDDQGLLEKNEDSQYAKEGIGFNLKKVDYICRRVSSTPARQAEFKLISEKLSYKGPQLIPGSGIRWNVAYNSWTQAYSAQKVIGQLPNDKSDKYAGKLAAKHFYKGCEILQKEWENINSLNQVLEVSTFV